MSLLLMLALILFAGIFTVLMKGSRWLLVCLGALAVGTVIDPSVTFRVELWIIGDVISLVLIEWAIRQPNKL